MKKEYRLASAESSFADIIWENEPISSGELVKLSAEKLEWKKSTTYTVLRRLCDRGIFINEGGVVSSVTKRDEFYSHQSRQFVEDTFGGSLPKFIAAFTERNKLSQKEIEEIRRIIDGEENNNG